MSEVPELASTTKVTELKRVAVWFFSQLVAESWASTTAAIKWPSTFCPPVQLTPWLYVQVQLWLTPTSLPGTIAVPTAPTDKYRLSSAVKSFCHVAPVYQALFERSRSFTRTLCILP